MGVVLKDFDELAALFDKLSYSVQKVALVKAAKAAAEPIRQAASDKAPRRTGHLAESEIASIAGTGSNANEVTVKIGPDKTAFYGSFLEWGTAFIVANPWLEPAFDEKSDESEEVFATVLMDEIEKALGI